MNCPNITDWIQAISDGIIAMTAIIGSFLVIRQLSSIKIQSSVSVLTNVLTIETEMNDRKEKVDDVVAHLRKLEVEGKLDDPLNKIIQDQLNSAIENWLNSVDRLCFCIKKNYLPEKDWKSEYRDYVIDLVKASEGKFGPGSKYTNIIDINSKWLRDK